MTGKIKANLSSFQIPKLRPHTLISLDGAWLASNLSSLP